uniref:LRP2-binding protein n=1 Tax=Phallusia mammillata TaxID=59560 RepID=A0A6F9DJA1_9ASCI|nr:LRP2-binding protein-like [Phallusia mammillata]
MEKSLDVSVAPGTGGGSVISTLHDEVVDESTKIGSTSVATDDQLFEKIESHLLEKINSGDKTAPFLLGQFYYEEGLLEKAIVQFQRICEWDYQAMYQLATMHYDGLGTKQDVKKGFELMKKVAETQSTHAVHLKHSAQFNIGRAYFEGYGAPQSNVDAERWWLMAADDGSPKGSILAQTMLGMLYARPDFLNLKQSFFWHSEACGNGSLESQGILGVMYLDGLGIAKNEGNAYECLKEAADRGNVYAQGRLVQLFYNKRLYTKASDLARRVVEYTDIDGLSRDTGCLASYIRKGIAYACFYLSRCLHNGYGVTKNVEEAKKYFDQTCELDPVLGHDFHMDVAYGLL